MSMGERMAHRVSVTDHKGYQARLIAGPNTAILSVHSPNGRHTPILPTKTAAAELGRALLAWSEEPTREIDPRTGLGVLTDEEAMAKEAAANATLAMRYGGGASTGDPIAQSIVRKLYGDDEMQDPHA